MRKLKIGVYQICKNEINFIEKWYDCIKNEQDGIFVTDTGSTDGTIELLKSLPGVTVFEQKIIPWRFDIQRNISLQNVPQDYDVLLCLDMDETMDQGWRNAIEQIWDDKLDFLQYPYVYLWRDKEEKIPLISIYNFKIHRRNGSKWIYPVHEVMVFDNRGYKQSELIKYTDSIHSYHYPDLTKDRNYMDILKLQISEEPNNNRFRYQIQREYFILKDYDNSIKYFLEFLNRSYVLVVHNIEELTETKFRSLQMRYIQDAIGVLNGNIKDRIQWLLKQIGEDPLSRENWVWLQKQYLDNNEFKLAYQYQAHQLTITDKRMSMNCDELCWSDFPDNIVNYAVERIDLNYISYPEYRLRDVMGRYNIDYNNKIIDINGFKIYNFLLHKDVRYSWAHNFLDIIYPPVFNNFNFITEGPYEIDEVFLDKDDVVFDCGAYLGLFTSFAQNKGCKVYAFEPIPKNLKYMEFTKQIYPDNIIIVPFGVFNISKSAKITNALDCSTMIPQLYNDTDNYYDMIPANCTYLESNDGNKLEVVDINTITIDEFVESNKIEKIDFIKADIEGAERFMLQGAVETIKKFSPKLQICTYHLPDDPIILENLIKNINPNYKIIHKYKKIFAYIPKLKQLTNN